MIWWCRWRGDASMYRMYKWSQLSACRSGFATVGASNKNDQRLLFFFAKLWFTFFLSSFSFSILYFTYPQTCPQPQYLVNTRQVRFLVVALMPQSKVRWRQSNQMGFIHPFTSLPTYSLTVWTCVTGTLSLHCSPEAMHVSYKENKHSIAMTHSPPFELDWNQQVLCCQDYQQEAYGRTWTYDP